MIRSSQKVAAMIFAIAAPIVLSTPFARALPINLVQNGGFETGTISDWTQVGYFHSYDFVTDWGHTGTYSLDLGNFASDGLGGVAQTISTVAGQQYNLSFFWMSAQSNAPGLAAFVVKWDNTTVMSMSGESAAPWTEYSFDVTGKGSDILTIEAFTNYGSQEIDDISVTANSSSTSVPEPSSLMLVCMGLFGVGFFSIHRRIESGRNVA